MQSIFNVTSITGDYANKKIIILTTFTVDSTTVNKKNVNVCEASSGTIVIYKLSVEDNKIIITLKEWPSTSDLYQITVKNLKDTLGRELITNVSKDIKFNVESKYKAEITSPVNNEAVLSQHGLLNFSICRINEDNTITTNIDKELKKSISLPTYSSNLKKPEKEAILDSEADISYEFQFASDMAFFNIVKEYKSEYTSGSIELDNGQYYMRARVVEQKTKIGDWSDTITFTLVPDCLDIKDDELSDFLTEAEKDYLNDVLAPVEMFLSDETELKILSTSMNGEDIDEFYIEFNLDLDKSTLPEKIIAYRRDF